MAGIIQIAVAGLENGISYALVGLALVLIYKTSRVFNFAAGTLGAFSGYLAYVFIAVWGLPWFVGAGLAVLAGIVMGLVVERAAIRPILGIPELNLVIATLGVDYFVSNLTQLLFGSDAHALPNPWPGPALALGPIVITRTYAVIGVTTVLLLTVLTVIVQRSPVGLAMRAFAEDKYAAELLGVPSARMSQLAWALASTVGAVTAVLFAPLLFVQLGYMSGIFVNGFTAAVLGGFVALPGTAAGGLLLGVVEALVIRFVPSTWAPMVPLLVILAIMLLRPGGVFVGRGALSRRV